MATKKGKQINPGASTPAEAREVAGAVLVHLSRELSALQAELPEAERLVDAVLPEQAVALGGILSLVDARLRDAQLECVRGVRAAQDLARLLAGE